jgi:hypothetical protein
VRKRERKEGGRERERYHKKRQGKQTSKDKTIIILVRKDLKTKGNWKVNFVEESVFT